MSATVLVIEGVLVGRSDRVELTKEGVEELGMKLYAAMRASSSRLVLASQLDRRMLTHWLRLSGLYGYDSVVPLHKGTVTALRAAGEHVGLYVDHDGERCAHVLQAGVPTLLFARPLYARASHRPDLPQLQRPWAQMVAESRAQHEAHRAPLLTVDE